MSGDVVVLMSHASDRGASNGYLPLLVCSRDMKHKPASRTTRGLDVGADFGKPGTAVLVLLSSDTALLCKKLAKCRDCLSTHHLIWWIISSYMMIMGITWFTVPDDGSTGNPEASSNSCKMTLRHDPEEQQFYRGENRKSHKQELAAGKLTNVSATYKAFDTLISDL